jgi:hypothetical protein
VVRVVVVSPGDVQRERNLLQRVVNDLNDGVAQLLGCRLSLWRWETDAHSGLHLEGPQGQIDEAMRIEQADVVIGIFWNRFGTPTHDAQSGTEYELRRAWSAWKKQQRPQVMLYFCERNHRPKSVADLEQLQRVFNFRAAMPKEQMWSRYEAIGDFERKVRRALTAFIRDLKKQEESPRSGKQPMRPPRPPAEPPVQMKTPVKSQVEPPEAPPPPAYEGARELARLAHDSLVGSVALSPDGGRIATASHDRTARVWDIAHGREVARFTHDGFVGGVAFSPDGGRIATASHDRTARVWEVDGAHPLARLTHADEVWGVAFSPDGARIATASHDRSARVWDVNSGRERARLTHDDEVWGVAFSHDGAWIVTASWDRTARVWEIDSARELACLTHDDELTAVAFGPHSARIATASVGSMQRQRRSVGTRRRSNDVRPQRYGYATVWVP